MATVEQQHTSALALAEASEWGALYQRLAMAPDCAEECDDFGMLPLHWACTAREVQPRVVRKLVDAYPVAVMLKNKGGLMPLHIAIKAKAPLAVLEILVHKDDTAVCEETPTGETPAELAQMYQLPPDTIAFLANVETNVRASGRVPPRPSRFRPMSSTMVGVEHRPSDVEKRHDVSMLRARGLLSHALPPRWKLDKKCNICQLKFTYFKSRHHCRNCGVSVCSTHSNRRLPLRHFGLEAPQRVCILCYDELRENGKPASAVVNMYVDKVTPSSANGRRGRRPALTDLSNKDGDRDLARPSLTHSQSTTILDTSHTHLSSGGASLSGFDHPEMDELTLDQLHDAVENNDDDDEHRVPRRRAQTGMGGIERLSAMKDQVKELEYHVRELLEQKTMIREAIEHNQRQIHEAMKDKHSSELAVSELRGDSIIDINRLSLGDKPSSAILPVTAPEDLEMPDDATLDVAATCHYLGLALLDKGDHESAIVELRKSVTLDRRNPDAWYHLARALHHAEEFYEAEVAVRRALALRPKNYSAMSLLGKILHSRGEHDKSIEVFREALGLMTLTSDSGDEDDVGSMTVGW